MHKKIMKKDNNQIICPIDKKKNNGTFEEISINRLIYELIFENQRKLNFENKKVDYFFRIGMIGNNYVGKSSLSKCYQDNKPLSKIDFMRNNFYDHFFKIIKKK